MLNNVKKIYHHNPRTRSYAPQSSRIVKTAKDHDVYPGDLVMLMNPLGIVTDMIAVVLQISIEDVNDLTEGLFSPPSHNHPDPRKLIQVMTEDNRICWMLASFVVKLEEEV